MDNKPYYRKIIFFISGILIACNASDKKLENITDNRPNILFIMTDDHAEKAISSYGYDLIHTPNIDRLAEEGIRFENSFVTNSICAPSRAVMLTGKYSHLNGLLDNRDEFNGEQVTFPKLLQKAGYQTALVGKWHLKTKPTGFDYWNILIGQGEYYNPRLVENGDTSIVEGYTTDIITDYALKTIEERDPSKPFCLLLHHKAPHRNWMPNSKYFDMYKDEDIPLPDNFWDDYSTRSAAAREQDMRIEDMYMSSDMKLFPEDYGVETGTGGKKNSNAERGWLSTYNRLTDEQKSDWDAHYNPIRKQFREANLSGKDLIEWKYQRYMKDYLRSVASVDENIGRVLDYLDEAGLARNTIVVYTSDQGFYLGEHGWYDKRFMYEESLSMPLIIRYPEGIEAGLTIQDLVLNLDFAPTFLDYAGVDIPTDMQGKSLKGLMDNPKEEIWRKSIYYHYYEYPHGWHDVKKHYGVRTDRYKLIHFYDDIDAWELYDLEEDPNEMNNVVERVEYQEVRDELSKELDRLKDIYQDI